MASAHTPSRADISRVIERRIKRGSAIIESIEEYRRRSMVNLDLRDEAEKWDRETQELLKGMDSDGTLAAEWALLGRGIGDLEDMSKLVEKLEDIHNHLILFGEPKTETGPKTKDKSTVASRDFSKVFVVHGHDGGPKAEVARFIEQLGFKAVVLHEMPNRGRTIITKFREETADVGFAVVLMTPDDHGGIAGQDTRPRARQNVIFELGFFIGALGQDRVAALVKGDVEPPSDFEGVGYIKLDGGGAWKLVLGQELQAAGFKIDLNRVIAR